jgi:hypothetical protein
MDWTADGRFLITSEIDAGPDGNERYRLVRIHRNGIVDHASNFQAPWIGRISRLGQRNHFLFVATPPGSLSAQLSVFSEKLRSVSILPTGMSNFIDSSTSWDGTKALALTRDRATSIWIGNPKGRMKNITGTPAPYADVAWTPDGRLLTELGRTADQHVEIINSDGSEQHTVIDSQARERGTQISPDGRYLVYLGGTAEAQGLWRVDSDGSNRKLLRAGTGEASRPSWQADSKGIYFSAIQENRYHLLHLSVNGGQTTEVVSSECRDPAVSLDSDRIACQCMSADGQWRLSIIDPKTRVQETVPLTIQPSGPYAWRPKHDELTYVVQNGSKSQLVALQRLRGRATTLTDLGKGTIFELAWTVLGDQFAMVKGTLQTSIVLIQASY